MNKFHAGDWVYNENYGVGRITVAIDHRYAVKFNGDWRTHQMQEARLTKIEHSLRPGHKVRFVAFRSEHEGIVTRITPEYVDIESTFAGKFTRHYTTVTKLADEKPIADLPLPPKFDTLKTRTVTTTFTDVDPELFKTITGLDFKELGLVPTPDTVRIAAAKKELDKQIADAKAELVKLQAARRAL